MTNSTHGNIKRFLVAASVALAIPLSAAAFQGGHDGRHGCGSFGGHGGPGMGGEQMMPHLRGLNLSDAQRDKAKAVRKAENDLRALTAADDFNDAKARALADTAAKAMSEMTLARAKAERQVFEVLTPEQRKQMAEMKAAGGPGRGRGDGPRGMGGEGRMPPPPR